MGKKILVSLTYYSPNLSGLTKYAKILAENLAKENHIEIITSRYLRDLKKKEQSKNITINRYGGVQIYKWFYMPFFVIKSIKKIYRNDMLILHFPSMENVFVSIIGRLFGKKIITVYHCKFKTESIFTNWLLEKWQNIGLFFSDKIIVNSFDYINGYNLLLSFRKKILEISPPIKIKNIKEKYNFGNNKIIGYLGRISKEKNIEIIIKAARVMKNYKFIIAGPTDTIGEKKYIDYIYKISKDIKNLEIIGKVKYPEKFYNSIDCLVLPSSNELESFGMVSAEAIKCKCPVVTSDIPGVRVPVLISKFGEIFENNNINDLVYKLKIASKKVYKIDNQNLLFSEKKFTEEYKNLL